MRYFACSECQQQIFFAKTHCDTCGCRIGYSAKYQDLICFDEVEIEQWQPKKNNNLTNQYFKPCYNYTHHQICNWVLAYDDNEIYCESCQLTYIIPPLDQHENIEYWRHLEKAKQRFLYLTQRLNIMPHPKKNDKDALGLRFNFLVPMNGQTVMTGHGKGIITLNAQEANVIYRETTRVNMGENYRTLLGHFRHESGHYYFYLIEKLRPDLLSEFRYYFGDERQDYAEALQKHYEYGPQKNWQTNYISSYATAHPWEDWAETWAHYLHMMETLETAFYAGLAVNAQQGSLANLTMDECPIGAQNFEKILNSWVTLTFNLNALNRSMGLEDAYPFKLSEIIKGKLRFIHRHLLDLAF